MANPLPVRRPRPVQPQPAHPAVGKVVALPGKTKAKAEQAEKVAVLSMFLLM